MYYFYTNKAIELTCDVFQLKLAYGLHQDKTKLLEKITTDQRVKVVMEIVNKLKFVSSICYLFSGDPMLDPD